MPTLIGLITLPFPKVVRKEENGVSEITRRVGFDSEGRGWALVERMTKLGPVAGMLGSSLARISFARWHLVERIPFVEENPIEVFDNDGAPVEARIE